MSSNGNPPAYESSSALNDIQEVNLTYLMLAQRLLRENLSAGMFRLGFCEDVATTILQLSPAQIVKLASSGSLICGFRLDDYALLSALGQDVLGGALQQAHATILLSQRASETIIDTAV
ncbi:MAG TPA: flagellar transcriptional regulator FlhD [Pusillimonas sp.]|uniref:flagellar transcriptional regulator FlhD n=1 Tax=Pusillimonas sp. TaxID=3040095 RepID=UPI002BCF7F6A|nr:flagellar transcriptional regulator FlhD [Pusillimonas sp.]HUH86730.1 flagellar transcriptional regulator FlhD [Pusillimonas sp.]